MEVNFISILQILAIIICSVCMILNTASVFILATTKKLKNSRFKSLVLFLSVSDLSTGIEFLSHVVLNIFNKGQEPVLYTCLVLKHLICGTVTFSLFQTLMICLERLNATSRVKNRLLRKLTQIRSVIISFVVIHVYSLLHLAYDVTRGPRPCSVSSTANMSFVLVVDIPVGLLILLIIIVYSVVIVRIVNQHKKVQNMATITTRNNNKSAVRLMHRNVSTLGAIICVTLVANVPRCVTAFCSLYTGPTTNTLRWLKISNHFLLLNPVFEPVIHVLRIREFRERFMCTSCKPNQIQSIELTQDTQM